MSTICKTSYGYSKGYKPLSKVVVSEAVPLYTFYCKCKKGTGSPLIIKHGNNEWDTHKINFVNVSANIEFNNSPPSIASRGATTVLTFTRPMQVVHHADNSYSFLGEEK